MKMARMLAASDMLWKHEKTLKQETEMHTPADTIGMILLQRN